MGWTQAACVVAWPGEGWPAAAPAGSLAGANMHPARPCARHHHPPPSTVCPLQAYEQGAIEARLVGMLQGRLKEYALQDLKCIKCKQVGAGRAGGGWALGGGGGHCWCAVVVASPSCALHARAAKPQPALSCGHGSEGSQASAIPSC